MAEIKIEKKNSATRSYMPFILIFVILLIAALVWFILDDSDRDDDNLELEETGMVIQPHLELKSQLDTYRPVYNYQEVS